jgi:mannose-6-phosphate isomerase-like protein (cupin superfamily)
MDVTKIVKELSNKYPNKKIIKLPEDNPREIICEISPGIAIAVIDKSELHYHKEITETYEMLKGDLVIYKNNEEYKLKSGENLIIEPGVAHCAVGNEAWVRVVANPPWTPDDHILI